jgi:hypothetical protein
MVLPSAKREGTGLASEMWNQHVLQGLAEKKKFFPSLRMISFIQNDCQKRAEPTDEAMVNQALFSHIQAGGAFRRKYTVALALNKDFGMEFAAFIRTVFTPRTPD